MAAKSVFIAHASEDDALVRDLRQALELLRIETWVDSERVVADKSLEATIREGIEKSDHLLVVVSAHVFNSEWVPREIEIARGLNKSIVPLMRSGVKIPALRLLFGYEPIAIPIGDGPAAVQNALPKILEAIGLAVPTGIVESVQAQMAPVADLLLELTDPKMEEADGKRRATATAKLTYTPADGSRSIESSRYTLTAPLGPIEAEEIAWYLERYINWPSGLFEERAQRTVEALPEWGRLLYDCVNDEEAHNALEAWKSGGSAEHRFTVKVDRKLIKGHPEREDSAEAATLLLSLPWELIHDENGYLFEKLGVRVRRSLPNRDRQPALPEEEPPLRVLLVSPRPEDESAAYIDHRVSARPLVETLSRLGNLAEFKLLEPPTFSALKAELKRASDAETPYHVVHFDGHGVYSREHGLGMLCFEHPEDVHKLAGRRSQLIDAQEIAETVLKYRIPLFFLEACQSAAADADPSASVAGRLLESGVASVAAMSHSVLVETARLFIAEFYKELLTGKRVGQAMLAGQRALKSDDRRGKTFSGELHLQDWFVPVLFQEEQDPEIVREVPTQQVEAAIRKGQQLALGELPREPKHQFLGRSRDLLAAERILSRERYLVVRGSGGEGKTTFAAELARWMVATRRFARAAFASVEQVTEARQVLFSLGDQFVPNFAGNVGTDDEHGRLLLERALAEHSTLLVIDNMESILDHEALAPILDLCARLNRSGQTRLIFTTREALPSPFAENALGIGRLDRDSAIRLVGNVLGKPPEERVSEEDLERLVEAVGGHARSLVLIAREVGLVGVRRAAQDFRPIMQEMEAKHPGERENSLIASAELSLRRLPDEIRQMIRPLSVFQGGGGLGAIALTLQLEQDRLIAVVRALIGVGLAEYVEPQYLRFDPALLGVSLTPEEREAATNAWAEAMAAEIGFLYEQRATDPNLANNLIPMDLPNLLAALKHLAASESPERVVGLATGLEALVAPLNRPRALARAVEIRAAAAQKLPEWSHARFAAEAAAVDRLIEEGRLAEAIRAAQALHSKCEAAGEAAYDGAMAQFTLGRALWMSGNAEVALPHLEQARQRFERLGAARMAGSALSEAATCLRHLGRYDEAAESYEQAIRIDEKLQDPRGAAVDGGQLATVRLLQENYPEALRLYAEVREAFERLNEPASVAIGWHQIGRVYQDAGQYEAAERAYQKSLGIKVQIGNRSGQAPTFNQLGNLYSVMGRSEDAVRLYRQAADIAVQLGDLRSEGIRRNNLASELIKLGRYDEARREIERAIECKRPFGHVAEQWKIFEILSDLERAVGNELAALEARSKAIAAYLAYRRDGGAPQAYFEGLLGPGESAVAP
ncbi:MAG TPA: tetratricopeptide repeat protein [Bryobacteraceae bacterium]